MVEAASDPFPPPSVLLGGGGGEIADIAKDKMCPSTNPLVPPLTVLPPNPSFPPSGSFTTTATISVPQYWSNARQQCVTGFTNTTIPSGPNSGPLKVTTTGNGANLAFTIAGSGFGNLPGPQTAPTSSSLPYIAIQDNTQRWQAGNSLNSDFLTLNVASWTDTTVSVNGLNLISGNLVMQPNDDLSVWVCNPSSGNCGAGRFPLAESRSPQLKVFVANADNVNLLFDVKIDGKVVATSVASGGSTGWLTFSGHHVVSESPTTPGLFSAKFRGTCDANGNVTLKPGDNLICTIVNVAATGCPSGQHCCTTPTSSSGCASGCVPNATACQPLCPAGKNECCGSPLATGRCSGPCIKSPPELCPE
jgi:hypothetical protein